MQSESVPVVPCEVPRKDLVLTWKNISYTIKKKVSDNFLRGFFGKQRIEHVELLNGVNGVAKSGTLMAIMGPSGAGKTTLLATISRRIKGDTVGDIFLNGQPVDQEQMARMSGFVPQEDLAVESLTVEEHMEFMARMKMDRRFRAAPRKERIANILTELGLFKCRNSKLSALSGGERKRVALAVQLLTEPSLLFCDEPTTGLDSYAAMAVTRTLREVATRGRIVICSLHQPASGLLDLFHEVVLLTAGRVAFQGTTKEATQFFNGLGLHCPTTFNSAEYYVSQLSVIRGKEIESYRKARWICDEFNKSRFGQSVATAIEDSCKKSNIDETLHPVFIERPVPTGDFKKVRAITQFEWLTWRAYVDYKRNFTHLFLRFILYMNIAVFVSTPYASVMVNIDQRGIQNVQGLIYLVVAETAFTFNYGVFYTFPRELPFLLRDIASDLYHPAPYYISKIAILMPGAIFQPLLYSILVFNIVGLKGGFLGFILFVIPLVLSAASASALGCLMSAAFQSVATASLFSVPLDFITLMFSGLFLHLGNLPAHIAWLKYLSQFYYGTEAVSLLQWRQIDHIDCPPDLEEPCVSTGLGVLEKYGYEPDNYEVDILGLLAIFALGHFAGFLAIRSRSRKEPVY
ncbi:protein scarlet isoform X2 [Cephus cinctus]|nr:protein scarlet isoform X2 [Cephus cinctus]XP_024937358.1 protein scarlet isoform X2 [Cephus cinctus]XP_024937359.1 protein scarlet isoform X2 [Cephus cinctus]